MELLTPKAPPHRRIVSVMPAAVTPQAERMSKWAHGERTMVRMHILSLYIYVYMHCVYIRVEDDWNEGDRLGRIGGVAGSGCLGWPPPRCHATHALLPPIQHSLTHIFFFFPHTQADENFRAPIVLAYNLRETILRQRNGMYLEKRMHCNEELKLLGFVSDFITAFHGLKKLITAPFPFPLVQMTR